MKKQKEDKDRELTLEELKEIMRDIEIEESDEEYDQKFTEKTKI